MKNLDNTLSLQVKTQFRSVMECDRSIEFRAQIMGK
jgi:hypothetical protein